MNPPSNTDAEEVACNYCGKAILPDTFEGTGGYCLACANDGVLTHGLYYSTPAPDQCSQTVQDEVAEAIKIPCRFCGRMILPATARRTGGFCMPHSSHVNAFLDTLGGPVEFGEPIPQEVVTQKTLCKETKLALGVLFSIMQPEDELRLFSVKPQGDSRLFAERGVALFRGGKCVTGFVAKWMSNPAFEQDHEDVCDREEISSAFGDGWRKIENKIPKGVVFVRFRTSQLSWMFLHGRAGYAIKYNGKYLWRVITAMN